MILKTDCGHFAPCLFNCTVFGGLRAVIYTLVCLVILVHYLRAREPQNVSATGLWFNRNILTLSCYPDVGAQPTISSVSFLIHTLWGWMVLDTMAKFSPLKTGKQRTFSKVIIHRILHFISPFKKADKIWSFPKYSSYYSQIFGPFQYIQDLIYYLVWGTDLSTPQIELEQLNPEKCYRDSNSV